MKLHWLAIYTLTFWSSLTDAQTCVDNIQPTFKSENYRMNTNDLVTDRLRGIEWSRCSLGQTWKNGTCQGKPELFTLSQALETADKKPGWRLPTLHELSSITELSCHHPAINSQYFPNTDSIWFWTETEFVNNRELAWQVFFGTGENRTAKKETTAAVRLVRPIKNNQH